MARKHPFCDRPEGVVAPSDPGVVRGGRGVQWCLHASLMMTDSKPLLQIDQNVFIRRIRSLPIRLCVSKHSKGESAGLLLSSTISVSESPSFCLSFPLCHLRLLLLFSVFIRYISPITLSFTRFPVLLFQFSFISLRLSRFLPSVSFSPFIRVCLCVCVY